MLRKIRVYGKLAKVLGQRVFEADVASAAEGVRFLLANFPGLEPVMAQGHYRVSTGKYHLDQDELHHPAGGQDIKITPVIMGAGGSAGKIIAGIALVALSFVNFGTGSIFAGIGLKAAGSQALLGIGATLVLQGVAQLLTPAPQLNFAGTDSQDDPRRSYSFTGLQQSSRQGLPVPIVYGEMIVGSVVASGGIDTVQVKV
jgi:predicted phage tail protein